MNRQLATVALTAFALLLTGCAGQTVTAGSPTGISNPTSTAASVPSVTSTPTTAPVAAAPVAPFGGEGRLLRMAAQLEQAFPWAHRMPDLSAFKA